MVFTIGFPLLKKPKRFNVFRPFAVKLRVKWARQSPRTWCGEESPGSVEQDAG